MRTRLAISLALLCTPLAILAQPHDHAVPPTAHAPATAPSAPTAKVLPMATAEVRRVDARAGKVTLKHGDIANLDMPPMTMVFQVRDPAQLAGLKPGDQIRFSADKVNGAYTVIELEAAPPR
jgi:Cu/Ag efflux protein CusF